MKNLLVLLFLSVAACGVEPESAEEPAPSAPLQQSFAAPPASQQLQPIQTAACSQIWDCERCGAPNRTRNVLVEYCDDGTERRLIVGACGQPCF